METFKLTVRSLSIEEKTILFGKTFSSVINVVKALDADQYVDLFSALKAGQIATLDGYTNAGINKIYVYCDLPVGSRYFSEELPSYRGKNRTEIYNEPIQKFSAKLNEFLLPEIKTGLAPLGTKVPEKRNTIDYWYSLLGIQYRGLVDLCLSGCFLSMRDNQIISIVSYDALYNMFNLIDPRQLHTTSKSTAESIWLFTQFLVPKEASNLDIELSQEDILSIPRIVQEQKQIFLPCFPTLFAWAATPVGLVVSEKYTAINSCHLFNNKTYLGLTTTARSPVNEISSPGGSYSEFSRRFETYLFDDQHADTSGIFTISTVSGRGCYSTPSSLIYLNTDSVSRNTAEFSAGVPELVELDAPFFESVQSIISDELTATGASSISDIPKFKKREFCLKREAAISLSEALNSRYISISTNDGKLVVLTKTSKAKESAKKMAITRKISTAIQPIIDFAMHIFAAADFETGVTTPRCRIPYFEDTALNFNYAATTAFDANLLLSKQEFQTYIKSIANEAVSNLYNKLQLDSGVMISWNPSGTVRYNEIFSGLTPEMKDKKAFKYIYSQLKQVLNDASMTNTFSPSSGQLNFVHLGNALYRYNCYSEYPTELEYLKYKSPYATYTNMTGKQEYYLYNNNFLGDDANVSSSIEQHKDTEYATYALISATTAFTFSEAAIKTLSTLRKSKSFTDYYNWFVEVKPELTQRLSSLLDPTTAMYKSLVLTMSYFEQILCDFKTEETQFLPEEKKKGRKKKKDIEEEIDEIEVEETVEVVSKEVRDATSNLLKSI